MTLLARLWIYQSERFPLKKTVPLLLVFSAASICVSARLADRPLPEWPAFAVGFVLAMALFFQMRVCDEFKDAEDDRRYRPERPIPRGLVAPAEVLVLGLLTLPLATAAAWLWYPPVLWCLLVVWVWLAAMTAEFGVPAWLKARPVLYLISHMAIMPLIDLLLTSIEWLPAEGAASKLWLFLTLSFVNGCVLEIGRKLWSPENEIDGVDTYSGLWGYRRAAIVWLGCVVLSFGFLVGTGFATDVGWITVVVGVAALVPCGLAARSYMTAPTPKAQDRMDTIAGLWVFFCYATAGFLPFLIGGFR
ncbi:UbiA family prenyltransferase [Roseibium sp. RKSG952]|uniref:UbiA family prenyltransferase n=1 Tax=Roseibium sp. RKSG952 TaxID=2529384 RepID=UPI0012BB652C|nr:UbiA family prenyltransferase [Roseibium sp. RKSG952]MTI03275.1 manganese transporter permease [Roseibium sp. RKSG952]